MNNKILVADDEKDTVKFMKKILERRGYIVDVAKDGLEAKALLERSAFDKVFLDCSMSGLTGFELIKLARERNPEALIIVFSGYAAADGRIANDLGANKFLQKPLSVEMIEDVLGD